MVTIPRYRQRTRVPLGGLSSSADFGPGLGDDLRQAGQALAVAGGIANTVTGMARRQPDRLSDPDRASLRAPASDKALLQTQEAVAGWGRAAADAVRSIQPGQDSTALNNPDGSPAQTLEIIARKAARSLPPDLRGAFEAAIASRQAALSTEAAARTTQAREARGQALSEEIEAQGVEDYLRQADLDETLGRAALASAVATRGARLRSAGVDGAAVREAQRQMLVEVEGGRIARLAASDPDRAAMVMGDREAVLPETVRLELTSAIQAEQLRREARAKVGDLAAGTADLADNLEGLMASSRAAAGDDPARAAAFHGAAIGAWRAARMAREAHEDAAWTKVAPYLSAESGVTAWTDLPGEVWADLTDRQKAAVQGHFAAPWRESDPEVVGDLKAMAASDPEGFRGLDLRKPTLSLRPEDVEFWKSLQLHARQGDGIWRESRADLEQQAKAILAVAADASGRPPAPETRSRLYSALEHASALKGRALTWQEKINVCQNDQDARDRLFWKRTDEQPNAMPMKLEPQGLGPVESLLKPSPLDTTWRGREIEPLPAPYKDFGRPRFIPWTNPDLGDLAADYEARGKGPEFISSGAGRHNLPDPGGRSYGPYQIKSRNSQPGPEPTRLEEFMAGEGAPWASNFSGLAADSPEFRAEWRKIGLAQPQAFKAAQREFILRTHYRPQARKILREAGVDVNTMSYAVQDVVFSVSVQHGPNTSVVVDAIKLAINIHGKEYGDEDLISSIYAIRIKRYGNDKPRYLDEEADALGRLRAERRKYPPKKQP
jgi:hypothetical protein